MAFDHNAFRRAEFEARTAQVRVLELAEFFGADDPVFIVRGLTGVELAHVTEAAQSLASRTGLAEALLEGSDKDRIDAMLASFGLSDDVPRDLCQSHELIIRGSVEPRIDRELSVLLAERYPVDHKLIALKITQLTGQGMALKKRPNGSIEAPTLEPA